MDASTLTRKAEQSAVVHGVWETIPGPARSAGLLGWAGQ